MKNIVLIGGGHGLSTLIRGIKNIDNISLKAIVTVADDGGSTGRLRELYNIPAVGDIRNVLVSMSESEEYFNELLDYRFKGEGNNDVVGHSLGNLILAALIEMNSGSLISAIKQVGKFLNVKGRVLPSSSEVITLFAKYEDGSIEKGEANIPNINKKIEKVYYDRDVKADKEALEAIKNADYIIYGIGSLYTSILPIVAIDEIKVALKESNAKKIYFANCMSQRGETYNYDLKNHVDALNKHGAPIDLIVRHNNIIPKEILSRYKDQQSEEVKYNGDLDIEVREFDLLDFSCNNVRHDYKKIKKVIEELIEN